MYNKNNYSYSCLGMVMTKMGKVPAPQQQSREGSGFLSSPKWPRAVPPPLLGLQSPLSKQSLQLLLKSLAQTLTSQQRPARLGLQQALRDSSPQGDGGLQKRTSSPKCNLNPPSSLPTVQDLQLILQLRTRLNKPICQRSKN